MSKLNFQQPITSSKMGLRRYLVVESISKSYANAAYVKRVLKAIDFTVDQGSFVTFFGPNGCGKTTLLNVIAGLTEPDGGSVIIDGKPVNRSKISFLFQNFADTLFPWKTCMDNIAFPLELEGIPRAARIQKVHSLLKTLDIALPLDQYPYQCSGGQKQLIALARALILDPDLLLMDEPFSALDYDTRISMENKLLDIWSKSRVTTLFISHDIDEAIYLSDKVIVLSNIPATVVEEVRVDLRRPRELKIIDSPEFYGIRTKVLQSFLKGAGR